MANIAVEGGYVRSRPGLFSRLLHAVVEGRARKGEQEAALHLLSLGDKTLRQHGYDPDLLRRGRLR